MSSRIDLKTLWPRNGHADSRGVNKIYKIQYLYFQDYNFPYKPAKTVTFDEIRQYADQFEMKLAVRDFFEKEPFRDAREFSKGENNC